jgi:hypothetical protein
MLTKNQGASGELQDGFIKLQAVPCLGSAADTEPHDSCCIRNYTGLPGEICRLARVDRSRRDQAERYVFVQ